MADEKLNKKEIRNEALQLLKQGTSKQMTFELLVDKHKYTKEIAEILENIPSKKAVTKYGKWNYVLLAILIITTIKFCLEASLIGTLLWYGLLIYVVATKRIKHYWWVTAMSSSLLVALIVIILTSSSETCSWTTTTIMLIIIIPSCILPIWLEKKLCPKPTEKKVQYTNSQGQQRMKIVYEFTDI
ncbi:MAG: hypothetical protein ACK417_05900 [Bacteroidia bacterium]